MKKIFLLIIIFLIAFGIMLFAFLYQKGCDFNLKTKELKYGYYSKFCSAWLYVPSHDGINSRSCNLKNPHLRTLEIIDTLYLKDKNKVYYICKPIEGADPITFQLISGAYTKDADNIFLNGKVLEGRDIATFENLGYGYTKDKNSIYYNDKELLVADVPTFTLLTKYHSVAEGTSVYGMDVNNIYYYGNVVVGAEPSTFKILQDGYAVDANNVFYLGKPQDSIDVNSILDNF